MGSRYRKVTVSTSPTLMVTSHASRRPTAIRAAKVRYVMVVDHTKETRRAEQISGGVTIDRKGAASDAELIARQQAEIEALRAELAQLTHND